MTLEMCTDIYVHQKCRGHIKTEQQRRKQECTRWETYVSPHQRSWKCITNTGKCSRMKRTLEINCGHNRKEKGVIEGHGKTVS